MRPGSGQPGGSRSRSSLAYLPVSAPDWRNVIVFPDPEAVAEAAAERIASRARDAVAARGVFRIALSGGSTPAGMFRRLAAADSPSRAVPWSNFEIYWSDERYVYPGNPASNAESARRALLDHVPIGAGSIHAVAGPDRARSVIEAATAYDSLLREAAQADPSGSPLDLVLLGLGEDGHTASLFPGDPFGAVPLESGGSPYGSMGRRSTFATATMATTGANAAPWARAVQAPSSRPPRERVTLSLEAIAASREVLFIVTGSSKRNVLQEVIGDSPAQQPGSLPAALVRARCGVAWMVDADAMGRRIGALCW